MPLDRGHRDSEWDKLERLINRRRDMVRSIERKFKTPYEYTGLTRLFQVSARGKRINGRRRVSPATAARLQELRQTLGATSSAVADNGSAEVIVLLAPADDAPFFMLIDRTAHIHPTPAWPHEA